MRKLVGLGIIGFIIYLLFVVLVSSGVTMEGAGKVPAQETDWDQDPGTQELSGPQDLNSCWQVIGRQSNLIEQQKQMLEQMSFQMATMQLQLNKLVDQQNKGETPSGNTPITVSQLSNVLDKKGSPPPEPFSVASGRSFDRFIQQFESYCDGRYSRNSYEEWTSELGPYLKDDILTMFTQYGGAGSKFSVMKDKLKQYCKGEESRSLTKNLEKFTAAHHGLNESAYLYAVRLEQLYIASHPGVAPDDSVELRVKFITSVNPTDRSEIQRELDTIKVLSGNGDDVPWEKILEIVKLRDDRKVKLNNPIGSHDSPEPFNTIWYTSTNVKDPRNYEDQYADHYTNRQNPRYREDHYEDRRSRPQWRNNRGYGPRSYSRDYNQGPWVNNVVPGRTRSLSQNRNRRHSGNQNNVPNRQGVYCDWCGNPGHIQRNCRRKLGLCLRCGSDRHLVRDCPKPSKFAPGNANPQRQFTPQQQQPQNQYSPAPQQQPLQNQYSPAQHQPGQTQYSLAPQPQPTQNPYHPAPQYQPWQMQPMQGPSNQQNTNKTPTETLNHNASA